MYCQNCGKEVSGNFCQNCGKAVNAPPAPPNNYYIPAPAQKTQSERSVIFKVFSVLSSVLCGLSLVVYWCSTITSSISETLLATHITGLCFFFVMSNILAIEIQPAKQGLSAVFYTLSCIALLFIAFMGVQYSLAVPAICILTVILIILTGVFGVTATKVPMQKKKIIVTAVVLLVFSIVIYGGARITNSKQNSRLSDVTINGIHPTQEQLDIIDEDYVLRRNLHKELYIDKLEELNFKKDSVHAGNASETGYSTYHYPRCTYLQISSAALSYGLGKASAYEVTYTPVKLDNADLRTVVEVYTTVFDREFTLDDTAYTFDDIVNAPLPPVEDVAYHSISAPEDEIQIELSITVNKNGYATLKVTYQFPANAQQASPN